MMHPFILIKYLFRQKRNVLHAIWVLLGLLLLGTALLLSYLSVHFQHQQAARTPIPAAPIQGDTIDLDSTSKWIRYQEELKHRRKDERTENIEAKRLDRIVMNWQQVYQQQKAVQDSLTNIDKPQLLSDKKSPLMTHPQPVDGPQSRQQRIHTFKRSQRRQSYRPKPTVAPKPEVAFHTQTVNMHALAQPSKAVFTPAKFVRAVIQGTQKVKSGQVVRLQLTETITVQNLTLPALTQLSGICTLTQNRLYIEVRYINLDGIILTTHMTAYTEDMVVGLPVQRRTVDQQLAEQMERQAHQQLNRLTPHIPIVSGVVQAASQTIQRIHTSRRKAQFYLPGNYRILLKIP